MSLLIVKSIEFEDLSDLLWSGAKERWDNATDNQRIEVWNIVEDVFSPNNYDGELPDMTTINDFIWFECDNVFYPEEID